MEQRAHLYTLAGVCALPRALSPHRELSPRSDMAALPQQGAAPLAPLRGYPCTPTKTVHPLLASVPFLRVLLSYPGGDTHDLLADGKELASEDIVKAAAEAGISERTVQTAKRNMGGILGARRVGGQWYNFIKKKQPPEPAS